MEIIVKGRNIDVTDRFRGHVEDKLQKIEQFAPRAQRVDVELTHEPNPAQAETSERIEITIRDKGPVIRAEAAASDSYGALDLAMGKLIERLRRVRDRKKEHPSKARVATPLTLTPDDVNIPQEKPHKEEKKLPQVAGEAVETRRVRYRTVGDMSCTGAVETDASTVADVIAEVAATRITERGATRADDRLTEAAMEDRKKEGYF